MERILLQPIIISLQLIIFPELSVLPIQMHSVERFFFDGQMCHWPLWLWVIWDRGEKQHPARATCTRVCWWFREKFAVTALWDSSNQLTPTRSFRLLPLLVICFETFALCLKNKYVYVHNCSDRQFHSVILQSEGQDEVLVWELPKKISLWCETLLSCSVYFHKQPERKQVFQIPELFIAQHAMYL